MTDLESEFRSNVTHLWLCGPRAVGELLAELGASRLVRTEIETLLRRYRRRLAPETVAALAGRWWQ